MCHFLNVEKEMINPLEILNFLKSATSSNPFAALRRGTTGILENKGSFERRPSTERRTADPCRGSAVGVLIILINSFYV